MKSKSKTISKSVNPTLIRFDWAMKRLLRQKSNFSVLEGFLSVLIGQEVKIINLKESESNQEHIKAKFNRVDIFVEASVISACFDENFSKISLSQIFIYLLL